MASRAIAPLALNRLSHLCFITVLGIGDIGRFKFASLYYSIQ